MAAVADGLVIPGRTIWIVLWFAILLLGSVGLLGAMFWGPDLRWRNLDELLRGAATLAVSSGMLAVLYGAEAEVGQALLVLAAGMFALAYLAGDPKRRRGGRPLRIPVEELPEATPSLRVIPGRRVEGPRRV